MRARKFLLCAVSLALTACNESGGTAERSADPDPSPDPGTAVTVTVHTGRGFECFAFNATAWGRVYCRGDGTANADLQLNSPQFFKYAEKTPGMWLLNGGILNLLTWDDTVCYTADVFDRPYCGSANNAGCSGVATYCSGEASLAGIYSSYPVVYGGPQYSEATNGTPELWHSRVPMMGADLSMSAHVTAGYVTDGTAQVGTYDEDCELSADELTLTCETFTVGL